MSMPRYACYKDSGVEWLGKLPAEWASMKARLSLLEPPCYGVLVPDFQLDGVPMMRITDIQNGIVTRADLVTISEELSSQYRRTIIQAGDVLLSVVGTIGEVVLVDESIAGVNLSRSIARLQVTPSTNRFYLAWVLRSDIFKTYVDLVCVGSAQRVLNMSDLSAFTIPVPPQDQQSAIAAFLDRETGKIDALIAEQEKLLTLLAEKRQATISHAVTRGLTNLPGADLNAAFGGGPKGEGKDSPSNPNAPMKDSGVPWLGGVPAHWDVATFQRCVYIQEGQVNPEVEPFSSMLLIAPNHVESGTGRLLYVETAEEQAAESGKYACNVGDVIYSKIRPALRKVCIAPEDCLCSADMYPLRGSSRLSNPFLMWFMLSESFSALAVLESERVAMPKINRESLKEVWLPIPPLEEQSDIVDSLESETKKLDVLTTETERAMQLLKERRSTLIAAAVTGKIDVRQVA